MPQGARVDDLVSLKLSFAVLPEYGNSSRRIELSLMNRAVGTPSPAVRWQSKEFQKPPCMIESSSSVFDQQARVRQWIKFLCQAAGDRPARNGQRIRQGKGEQRPRWHGTPVRGHGSIKPHQLRARRNCAEHALFWAVLFSRGPGRRTKRSSPVSRKKNKSRAKG